MYLCARVLAYACVCVFVCVFVFVFACVCVCFILIALSLCNMCVFASHGFALVHSCICVYIQLTAFGVSCNRNLQSQSRQSLFNRTCSERAKRSTLKRVRLFSDRCHFFFSVVCVCVSS